MGYRNMPEDECFRTRTVFVQDCNFCGQTLARAEAERDRIIASANKECGIILEQARERGEQLIADKTREAEEIWRGAQDSADAILAQAQMDAECQRQRIIAEGRKEADDIRRKAEEDSRKEAENLVGTYVLRNQQDFRDDRERLWEKLNEEGLERLGVFDEIHDEMCSRTNAVQASWMGKLDETVSALGQMKEAFYRDLRQWQVALYRAKLQPLADLFSDLYRIVNIDRLIWAEIRNQEKEQHKRQKEDAVDGLLRLERSLEVVLKKYENALQGVGLYAYYPAKGELFEEFRHVCETDLGVQSGRVAECMVPGIAKKTAFDGPDEILVRAVVQVEAEVSDKAEEPEENVQTEQDAES